MSRRRSTCDLAVIRKDDLSDFSVEDELALANALAASGQVAKSKEEFSPSIALWPKCERKGRRALS